MLTKEQNELICQTGPATPMGEVFRRFWMPVLLSSELPTPDCPPVRVRLLGEDLVAFRSTGDKVGLVTENCPHRRASLFFGRNEEGGLRCAYHGWKYDVNGRCVDMPNEPAESNFKNKVHITAYPAQEAGGVIWAYLGPKDKQADFPQIEWATLPESHRFVGKVLVECNYLQALEGEIDNSHVGFLHTTLSMGLDATWLNRQRKDSQILYITKDKAPRGFVKDTPYGLMMGWRREADEEHYHWHINQWIMPYGTLIGSPPGETHLNVIRPPRDDETSWGFIIHWNPDRPLTQKESADFRRGLGFLPELIPGAFRPKANMDNDYFIDRSLQRSYSYTGIGGSFYNQDRAVTESMGPIIDRSKEHLGTSDAVVIAVRRKLIRAARELRQGKEPYAAQHGEVFKLHGVDVLLPRGDPFDEGAKDLITAHR